MASNDTLWMNANFNPWKAHIGDCAIRAIAAATGLDYRIVCKKLNQPIKPGQGLLSDDGIDLYDIFAAFDEYFDIVEDFYANQAFVPPEMEGSEEAMALDAYDEMNGIDAVSRTTLAEFISEYANQGVFLVSLEGNPSAKKPVARSGGHIVCVRCVPGKRHCFIDTWDSREMYVDSFMRVKKPEPFSSPNHWRYDKANHRFIV